jgi:excisionase family DNA binding protein
VIAPDAQWLTIEQARVIPQCGAKLLRREIKAGRLRAARLGLRRDIRIHRDWLQEWLQKCATPTPIETRK